ncbi:hypothetical protein [Ferrovibrio sp.]|uniref:hypothetical protein n=1 Tax=Ferrovibrio sp. TaxID=1917215 RepID=UPI003515B21B
MARKKADFLPPPQDLQRRAVNFTKGYRLKLEPAELRRLEEVVEKATDAFTAEVAERLRQLRQTIADVAGGNDEPQAMRIIRALSLDIKGMGGTFRYPLLSAYAKSLNDFAVQVDRPSAVQTDILAAHIDAMYVVMAERITGVGGRRERDLLEALQTAVEKHMPRHG